MWRYNPKRNPDPNKWLALEEADRILMVGRFHRKRGEYGESLKMHAAFHAVVESQLPFPKPGTERGVV